MTLRRFFTGAVAAAVIVCAAAVWSQSAGIKERSKWQIWKKGNKNAIALIEFTDRGIAFWKEIGTSSPKIEFCWLIQNSNLILKNRANGQCNDTYNQTWKYEPEKNLYRFDADMYMTELKK